MYFQFIAAEFDMYTTKLEPVLADQYTREVQFG